MFADFLLKLLGNNPAAYPTAEDKWITISVELTMYSIPIFLILLLISPFIFLWLRKKRFSLKNIVIAVIVSAALVTLAIFFIYVSIMLLHAHTVREIYNIK